MVTKTTHPGKHTATATVHKKAGHEVQIIAYEDDGTGPVTQTHTPDHAVAAGDGSQMNYVELPPEQQHSYTMTTFYHQLDVQVDGLHYTVVLDGPNKGVYRAPRPAAGEAGPLQTPVTDPQRAKMIPVKAGGHADDVFISIENKANLYYMMLDTQVTRAGQMAPEELAVLTQKLDETRQGLASALLELSHDKVLHVPVAHAAKGKKVKAASADAAPVVPVDDKHKPLSDLLPVKAWMLGTPGNDTLLLTPTDHHRRVDGGPGNDLIFVEGHDNVIHTGASAGTGQENALAVPSSDGPARMYWQDVVNVVTENNNTATTGNTIHIDDSATVNLFGNTDHNTVVLEASANAGVISNVASWVHVYAGSHDNLIDASAAHGAYGVQLSGDHNRVLLDQAGFGQIDVEGNENTITGGTWSDTVYLYGSASRNVVNTGAGDDRIIWDSFTGPNAGTENHVDGGEGNDTLVVQGPASLYSQSYDAATGEIKLTRNDANGASIYLKGMEQVEFDDVVHGKEVKQTLQIENNSIQQVAKTPVGRGQ